MTGGDDDWIVVSSGTDILRVAVADGMAEPLDLARTDGTIHAWPQLLPDGKAVLYTAYEKEKPLDDASIMLQPIERGKAVGNPKVIWKGGYRAQLLPTGHLVYVSQSSLFAAVLDRGSNRIVSLPIAVVEQLAINGSGGAPYDVGPDGTLVSVKGSLSLEPLYGFEWLDRSGIRSPFPLPDGAYGWFQLSPDGLTLRSARAFPDKGRI